MPDPRQLDSDRIRVVLDRGGVVELDGGTLVLNGEESASVVLRLAPWRARSIARVLQEWTSVSRIFHHPTRPGAVALSRGGQDGVLRSWAQIAAASSVKPCGIGCRESTSVPSS
jgi:hypothetical protein